MIDREKHCPKCQEKLEIDAQFCQHCGTKIPDKCPKCGEKIRFDTLFCTRCGTKIHTGSVTDKMSSLIGSVSDVISHTKESLEPTLSQAMDKAKSKIDPSGAEKIDKLSPTNKKLFFALVSLVIILAILFFVFLGGSNDIKRVKKGILGFDSSLTVGEALENFSGCGSKNWESFKTTNGRNIVQFECVAKDILEVVDLMKKIDLEKYNNTNGLAFKVKDVHYKVQFILMKDGNDFEVGASALEYTWNDGKKSIQTVGYFGDNILRSIYANKPDGKRLLAVFDGIRKHNGDVRILGIYNHLSDYYRSRQ